MQPTLTWIDLTAADRDKMRRVLDFFKEQGTIDEMGLGTLRDALADILFPGTSTLHTRLRYALFVPWTYQRLEKERVGSADVAEVAREAEVALIEPLSNVADANGVIGSRAGKQLARLPSSVYWGALGRWGLFRPGQSRGWLHARFSQIGKPTHGLAHPDDPGVLLEKQQVWHPRMPGPPSHFPKNLRFDLTRAEAEFLRGCWEDRCEGSLLSLLAQEGGASPAPEFWEDADVLRVVQDGQSTIGPTIELARRFSLLVEGMPLLYNLLLAERRFELIRDKDDADLIESYRAEILEWQALESQEAAFEPAFLWSFMATVPRRVINKPTTDLMGVWSERCNRHQGRKKAIADDKVLRRLVAHRELSLKGTHRARLVNLGRLREWNGSAGVGRMSFRWPQVRQLLIDLHRGLRGESGKAEGA